jgi:AraC family transcriptional regulator, transcriptional activator of pobA
MSLSSITMPTMNITGSTSRISTIGTLNNDFALYLIQGNIPGNKYPRSKDAFEVIIVNSGTLDIEIDNKVHSLSKYSLVYLPPNTSFSIKSSDTKLRGYIMMFSNIFVESLQVPMVTNKNSPFVRQSLSEDIQYSINQIFMLIKDEISNQEHIFRKEKLLSLVSILFIDLLNVFVKSNSLFPAFISSGETGRKVKISRDFFGLVKEYSREQRQVGFYADKLCITPKYLTLLLKQSTGKSANEWITNAVIAEAKSLLRNSGNSIKEVAYTLNFANQSFFGKYFKKIVGTSPKDYQRNMAY